MGLTSEMKNLSEDILASFKNRIKENEELVIEVQKTLDGFRKDHQEMATVLTANAIALKTELAKGEKARLKEADILMKEMIKDHKEMAAILRAGLDKGEKARLKEADILMKKMIREHKEMALVLRTGLDEDEKARLMEADILMKKMIKEHKEMTAALRARLDNDEKTRMTEFVALMKSINEKITEIFTYTDEMLVKSEEERLQKFVALMKSINEDISGIFTYTHDLLEKSEKERLQEFAILIKSIGDEVLRIFTYTKNMLVKGEADRLQEFNVVMKGIKNDVKNLKKAVAELLGDFAQDREGASAAWKKMSDILAQLRKTAVVPQKLEMIEEVKPSSAIVSEAIEAAPVVFEEETPVAFEIKPMINMTLEEKVLDYINKHPKGLRISEMEQPLGETRMKLGFVAKALLAEGKVQKLENIYFPLK
jgi:hypothetical protein